MIKSILVFSIFIQICLSLNEPQLRKIGEFSFKKPAFVSVHPNLHNTSKFDLLISSFGVSLLGPNPDRISVLSDIGSSIRQKKFEIISFGKSVIWPNEVTVIGKDAYVPGGFLVPGKKGHISKIDYSKALGSSDSDWIHLVENDKGFFHRIMKLNMLNKAATGYDSGERLVSCRGYKSVFGKSGGEMVMLDPNGDGSMDLLDIVPGCDCFFAPVDLNEDGIIEFIAPAFFGKKLLLIWTEHPKGDYRQTEYVRTRVIDDTIGANFDVQMVDLNGDGRDEILLTNHENNKKRPYPGIFAYEIEYPEEKPKFNRDSSQISLGTLGSSSNNDISEFMKNLKFIKHVLSNDFDVVNRSFMAAAPGSARAVIPGDSRVTKYRYPVILASGDGTEKAYYLRRDTRTNDEWSYKQEIFHDCKGTVGSILAHDIDGDGWLEVFVPCYDTDMVFVYKFASE